MIVGLGIDGVEIERFAAWPSYSPERLAQIFSLDEINYALSVSKKSSERLAARFAAKEAAYKALAHLMPVQMALIAFCKHVQVINDIHGAPSLQVDFRALALPTQSFKVHLSLSHAQPLALAVVIVEKI